MRRLRLFEHITLDGVVQHTADQDFPYADWTLPYRSPEGREAVTAAYGDRFDLLLGRCTYDLWSTHWPLAPSSPLADRINGGVKFVATHRPESLGWGPAVAVGPNLVQSLHAIKAGDGPDLILSGSSTLTSVLLQHGLADELVLIVYPVLLGRGKKLFAEGTPPQTLRLVATSALASGVLLNSYTASGPLQQP